MFTDRWAVFCVLAVSLIFVDNYIRNRNDIDYIIKNINVNGRTIKCSKSSKLFLFGKLLLDALYRYILTLVTSLFSLNVREFVIESFTSSFFFWV